MKTKWIIAILPLIRFGLPHREGQTVELEEKQADEIIEAGYAKEHVLETDVPATDVPVTDVPATDVPATDVPAESKLDSKKRI